MKVYGVPQDDFDVINIKYFNDNIVRSIGGGTEPLETFKVYKNKLSDIKGIVTGFEGLVVLNPTYVHDGYEYIRVNPKETLLIKKPIVSGDNYLRYSFLDKDQKLIIRKVNEDEEIQLIVPDNAYFFNFSINPIIQLEIYRQLSLPLVYDVTEYLIQSL